MRNSGSSRIGAKEALETWHQACSEKAEQTGETVIALQCKLITPLFGGGVKAGEVDRAMSIRATAIRGHLRFWWRLLQGRKIGPDELFRKECSLWGGISEPAPTASRVAVRVKAATADNKMIPANGKGIPRYALILEPGKRGEVKLLEAPYEFQVTLRFHCDTGQEQIEQVREALRWWASFGGLGARTRRGLGAIEIREDGKPLQAVTGEEAGHAGGCLALGKTEARDAISAWKSAVESLQDFRQGQNTGRNPGPGRSRWPEADQIRRHTGRHSPKHAPVHPVQDAYPRAAFGLPIVFRFKDDRDPAGHTLEPEDSDRMASPLILRPYFDGRCYRPMALLLPGWEERISVPVRFANDRLGAAWPENLTEREKQAKEIEPMRDHGTDVLTAFMKFFEE